MGWARRRARLPGSAALVERVPPPALALTFDDGPHRRGTPAVLEALAACGATATFFVLGDRVREESAVAREILAGGHEIGLHGDRHERVDLLAVGPLTERLARARAELEDLLSTAIQDFRPPWGRASWRTFQAVRRAGMRLALWSHDPRDWEPGAEHRIPACLVAGAVVLLHDGTPASCDPGSATAAALRDSLPAALDGGLVPTTLARAAGIRR
jgi:peptidoglycan/xylan/chitin deacetylase (PgdA/CDA1 family)